jgi:hypothetical protein
MHDDEQHTIRFDKFPANFKQVYDDEHQELSVHSCTTNLHLLTESNNLDSAASSRTRGLRVPVTEEDAIVAAVLLWRSRGWGASVGLLERGVHVGG